MDRSEIATANETSGVVEPDAVGAGSDTSTISDAIASAQNSSGSTTASVPTSGKHMSGGGINVPNPLNASQQIAKQGLDALNAFVKQIINGATDHATNMAKTLVNPMVGTPAPEGPPGSVGGPINIAFSTATNSPWDALMGDIYWGLACGLALGIQFIALAFIGVRYKSIDPAVRKKLTRRLFFAFMAIFFWLPTASLAGQFFNLLGHQIVGSISGTTAIVNFLSGIFNITSGFGFGTLILIFILAMYVYIKAVLIFIGRWMGIILLTLFMPVLASFWALEVWPLNRFSGLSVKIAGSYPGLLAAGIPPAILIRIAIAGHSWGLPSNFSVYVNLLVLLLAAKSQRMMVEKSSSMATKGAQMFSGTAKTGLVLGATAAGGTAAGSMVSAGMKAKEGKTANMEAYQLHRSLSSQQPPQAGSSTGDSSESAETPPSSGSSADTTSNGSDSSSADSGDSGSEESVSGGDLYEDDEDMGALFEPDRKDLPTDRDNQSPAGASTNGNAPDGSDPNPTTGDAPTSSENNPSAGWYSTTNHGQTPDGEAIANKERDGYAQGDRVVVTDDDFDHTEKRAVVTEATDGELQIRPETGEVSEDMTIDASDVAMYERGPEVDREFNEGEAVRITADGFEGADNRATVTRPPVPGKKATVRPVNMPGEVKVSPEDLTAVSTGSSTPQPTDDGGVEPVVPPGWGDEGGTPGSDPSFEPEPLNAGEDWVPSSEGQDSSPAGPSDTGGSESPTVEPEPANAGDSSADMEPEPVSGDPPRPGDEVPDTTDVETPGRSASEITDSSGDQPRPGDTVPDTDGAETSPPPSELANSSNGEQPPQTGTEGSNDPPKELSPSDIVPNPDQEKYQRGPDDDPVANSQASKPLTGQTGPEPQQDSSRQSGASPDAEPEPRQDSSQQPDTPSDEEDTAVGSDAYSSIDAVLGGDDEPMGPDESRANNMESDD